MGFFGRLTDQFRRSVPFSGLRCATAKRCGKSNLQADVRIATVIGGALAACTASGGATQQLETRKLVIGPDTVVCSTVTVDQALWPVAVTSQTPGGLSYYLTNKLREEFGATVADAAARHIGSQALSPDQFVANPWGTNPRCSVPDVLTIAIRYSLDGTGKPFVAALDVQRGSGRIQTTFARDIQAEWRAGTLKRLQLEDPLQSAVADDIAQRAKQIHDSMINVLGD